MTSVRPRQAMQYPRRTIDRADRAMRCAPFQLTLYDTMVHHSVGISAIAGRTGVQNRYTRRTLSELAAETELLWLIQVGLLRREVDGQGLTDSFRVTPLGRQLVQKWHASEHQAGFQASWSDRLSNALIRWLRLPF